MFIIRFFKWLKIKSIYKKINKLCADMFMLNNVIQKSDLPDSVKERSEKLIEIYADYHKAIISEKTN